MKLNTLVTIVAAFLLTAASQNTQKPTAKPVQAEERISAAAPVPTLAVALTEMESLTKRRTSTQARTSSIKQGVEPVTRDWEIDANHLTQKARKLTTMKPGSTERENLQNQVTEHALRLIAEDSRRGNEDREMETYNAVRNVLLAIMREK